MGRLLILLDSAYLSIKTYSYWSLYLYQGDAYFSFISFVKSRSLKAENFHWISDISFHVCRSNGSGFSLLKQSNVISGCIIL